MFDQALTMVLGFEGGFVNDPNDPGGATNFGITQNVYNNYRRRAGLEQQTVKSIAHNEVCDIYRQNYWVDGGCDKLDLLDPYLALVHFDACVNTGINQAARILQRCVGAYPDGVLGPVSMDAVKAKLQSDRNSLRICYLAARTDFYLDLIMGRALLRGFLPSWMRRIQKLLERWPEHA